MFEQQKCTIDGNLKNYSQAELLQLHNSIHMPGCSNITTKTAMAGAPQGDVYLKNHLQ